jgi:hypothetical protein
VRKVFSISTKELRVLIANIAISLILAAIISPRAMQQHPDSMISGGLRWLSEGPFSFQYNTYGPFSYFIYGVFSLLYFCFGFALGFWNSPTDFEIAYRVNTINVGNLKFSVFYLALNIFFLIQSLNLLTKCSDNFRLSRRVVLGLSIFAPIIIFQFTLETVEPLVFFGVSLAIYTFTNVHKLANSPSRLIFLSTLSWLLTFGVRISTLPIVFLYSLASMIKLRHDKKKTLLYSILVGSSFISIVSYSPVFLDRKNLDYVLSINKSLATSSLKLSLITENFEILKVNLGYWTPLFLVALFHSIKLWRQKNIFEFTQVVLMVLYLLLYLVNQNGHPKYLIPLIPLLVLFLVQWEPPKFERHGFLESSRVQTICVAGILLMGGLQLSQTLSTFVSGTNFDSRLEIKKLLIKIPDWQSSIVVTENVLAEITRGPDPNNFKNLRKKVLLDDRDQACADIVVLSSTSYSSSVARQRLMRCSKPGQTNFLVTISPFTSNHLPQGKRHWSALLSLGTLEDVNRVGYGPIYWVGIDSSSSAISPDRDLCSKVQGCKLTKF